MSAIASSPTWAWASRATSGPGFGARSAASGKALDEPLERQGPWEVALAGPWLAAVIQKRGKSSEQLRRIGGRSALLLGLDPRRLLLPSAPVFPKAQSLRSGSFYRSNED